MSSLCAIETAVSLEGISMPHSSPQPDILRVAVMSNVLEPNHKMLRTRSILFSKHYLRHVNFKVARSVGKVR